MFYSLDLGMLIKLKETKMKLNKDNLKVVKGLYNKYNDKGRMPSIKSIAILLDTLGIKTNMSDSYCTKSNKSAGARYFTSGGNKTYYGTTLKFQYNAKRSFYMCFGDDNTFRFNVDTTDTCYSYNTYHYSGQLLHVIADVLAVDNNVYDSLDAYFFGHGDFDANCKKVLGDKF